MKVAKLSAKQIRARKADLRRQSRYIAKLKKECGSELAFQRYMEICRMGMRRVGLSPKEAGEMISTAGARKVIPLLHLAGSY